VIFGRVLYSSALIHDDRSGIAKVTHQHRSPPAQRDHSSRPSPSPFPHGIVQRLECTLYERQIESENRRFHQVSDSVRGSIRRLESSVSVKDASYAYPITPIRSHNDRILPLTADPDHLAESHAFPIANDLRTRRLRQSITRLAGHQLAQRSVLGKGAILNAGP
jgi:hypothetical protein